MQTAEVIVIGLGAMGSAALYQLARNGVSAIGIDRFDPPHAHGSSHGDTRITRAGVGEGAAYGALVRRSHQIWREIEAETGEELFKACGFLAIDGSGDTNLFHGKRGFIDATIENAKVFSVLHEELSPQEAQYRFPQFRLERGERVYFEPGGGLVFPERCIAAQLRLARAAGARVRTNEPVLRYETTASGVVVRTAEETYHADRIILAAGAWTPGMAGSALGKLRLLRQALHWFEVDDLTRFAPGTFPTFIWVHGPEPEDSCYGFPAVSGMTPGLKIAEEQYTTEAPTPEAIDRHVPAEESRRMFARHVDARIVGAQPSILRSAGCIYTFTPDGDFVIDRADPEGRMILVSACSGHGFKHSAGIGELVAKMHIDGIDPDPTFGLKRPVLMVPTV